MIDTHLVEKISLKFFFCWVSHTLTRELWQKRVELAGQLLCMLEQQQRVGFRDIATVMSRDF
jgi:hypothetical protein